ncbi:aldo/keto reductase [Marinicauda salina]|uniref:Aldo/keto reductase n=1 Tax=Marinicauda salina TaxID=2135793 RepID=A0A2U2BRZ7_9PROT|nr:aldo/keto reductase [Marinicauda salina]PWE16791.1 aldo/keto reductase [Marinicauda salina]
MKHLQMTGVDRPVSRLGLGCMGMSEFYGPPSDDADSFAVMARALELGVNFFDTADMYGQGENERLVGRFAADRRDDIVIASKCGIRRDGNGALAGVDTSPSYIKQACEASLARLGVETIDLYYLHRLDGVTPVEDSMGALADLAREGKIRAAGLSEVSPETLKRACAVFPVSAVQSEYSLTTRDPEDGMLAACEETGSAFVAYSPLGRGLLTGAIRSAEDLAETDLRRTGNFPRFSGDALAHNVALADQVAAIAGEKNVTPAQIALAWLLRRDNVVPIPGTRKIARLEENVGALDVALSDADAARLEAAVPPEAVEGERYSEASMRAVGR